MIVVTVGTHHQPFDRLVRAAGELAAAGHEVVVQRGTSSLLPAGCVVHDYLPWDGLRALLESASHVVCHAGPASVFEAWDAGHVPWVVPRDPSLGEHVDDHQLRFVGRLDGRAVVVHSPSDLPGMLNRDRDVVRQAVLVGRTSTDTFVAGLDAEVARVLRHSTSSSSSLRRWFR